MKTDHDRLDLGDQIPCGDSPQGQSMKTDHDRLDLGDRLPLGFCDECCTRMARGALYKAVELPNKGTIVHAYCLHREAGATIFLRPGRPLRWQILTPIDVREWEQVLALRVPMLAGALADTPSAAVEKKVEA